MNKPLTGKRRILRSAARMLKSKGLNATKLSDIAEGAGMLAPSIYHHFKSKNALVEQVMLDGIYNNLRYVMAKVEGRGSDCPPVERLRTGIIAHVEYLLSDDDFSSAVARVFEELPVELKQRVLAAYASFDHYWRDLIVAASPQGSQLDPAVARKFLIAMLNSAPSWYRSGRLSGDEIARQAADLFLHGFLQSRAPET